MADENGKAKQLAPPYTAFQSLKNLFGTLKENGLPGRIDRSLLSNFSGQTASQILTALRFLRLTDEAGHPTQKLNAMVMSYGTDNWDTALEIVVTEAYPPLFELNLATASPAQFNDLFRKAYPVEGDTFRKCVTFFLNAAREARIPISSYIMQNKKPRAASPPKKRAAKVPGAADANPKHDGAANAGSSAGADGGPAAHQHHQSNKTAEQVLLEILDPTAMSSDEQQAVFALLLYLKKRPAHRQSGGHQ